MGLVPYIAAKKSLGQNFLKDPVYLKKIVEAAGIGPDDQVLEIGPGLGHLTRALAARARNVLALELDERVIPYLREEFKAAPNVEIMHTDALVYPYEELSGKWIVASNLPYNISTPIIQRLLKHRSQFSSLTLMLQKEVAERITAPPGCKEYGYLSVLVQFFAEPRMEFSVPPEAFTPKPKVDSAVVTLIMRETTELAGDEAFLIRVIKTAFSQRRKTLRNSLKQLNLPQELINRVLPFTGIDLNRRAETLSVHEFCLLSDFLKTQPPEKPLINGITEKT